MNPTPEDRKCSAKTVWRLRKSLQISGAAFQTVEDGLEDGDDHFADGITTLRWRITFDCGV